jgi:hypothetical protein
MATMKAGEMRTELESYGISTKSFLEKRDFVKALEEARAAGKAPQKQPETNGEQKQAKKEPAKGKKESSSGGASRAERLQKEMEKAKGMKVGDLRKELEARGVSTKSFFEKTEFVKAYAEAIVDGKGSSSGGSSGGSSGSTSSREEEVFDSSYREVSVRKMDKSDPRLLQGSKVIDVTRSSKG